MQIDLLIFDLDGTLLNSKHCIIKAINGSYAIYGSQSISYNAY
ncbi:MAG: HAD hydrolase-like protein [Candidatus Margulisbacteria bacterium]|nr:HAD hydrolase-like protein [Candidatus Margulisiibacteriota bacterium]